MDLRKEKEKGERDDSFSRFCLMDIRYMTQQQGGWESLPIIGIKNPGDILREEDVLRDGEEKRRE